MKCELQDKTTIKTLLELHRKGKLKVNPDYQRGEQWQPKDKKKLIDSILRGYSLPLIYLHRKEVIIFGEPTVDLEVIDGQQRIIALHEFREGKFKLFDPKDENAKFPKFIKDANCPWANLYYHELNSDLQNKFNETILYIVNVTTDNNDTDDEARDLFIRLQSGIPLNAQLKRDAWPGGYTAFVLEFGGKIKPGHDFFRLWVKNQKTDRGNIRQLCAQIGMMVFKEVVKGDWLDIGSAQIDDFYYENIDIDFDITKNSRVAKFAKILNLIVEIFTGYNGPQLKGHEAIHIVLLVNSLMDDYTKSWQKKFIPAFEDFRAKDAEGRRFKKGEFWEKYGSRTQTQSSQANTIQIRHNFFTEKMFEFLKPALKDNVRTYGQLEREIIYYRDKKKCAFCDGEIKWDNLEIHHLVEHQHGGQTTIENGVSVHRGDCHPKGQEAIDFYEKWKLKQEQESNNSRVKKATKEGDSKRLDYKKVQLLRQEYATLLKDGKSEDEAIISLIERSGIKRTAILRYINYRQHLLKFEDKEFLNILPFNTLYHNRFAGEKFNGTDNEWYAKR